MGAHADRDDVVPMALLGAMMAAILLVACWLLIDVLIASIEGQPFRHSVFSSLAVVPWIVIVAVQVALLTAFPIGIIYGRLILLFGGTTKGKGALAGALTGVTLTAALVVLGADGLADMALFGSALVGLGAVSGLLAFRLVVGGTDKPQPES